MKLLIIQTSPPNTASTFLVNSIYGLIPELFDKNIFFYDWDHNFDCSFENIISVKTHVTNIDEFINKYKENYKLIFICSERSKRNYLIDKKYTPFYILNADF